MSRTESCELTVLCLLHHNDHYLLQDRIKADWQGYTLPGGHIEPGESVVDAVVREMREETGLTVKMPRLCGVKQFPLGNAPEDGRYLVFLFTADEFDGELKSSEEGQVHWIHKDNLSRVNLVSDFSELLTVMLNDNLSEFQYIIEDGEWKIVMK